MDSIYNINIVSSQEEFDSIPLDTRYGITAIDFGTVESPAVINKVFLNSDIHIMDKRCVIVQGVTCVIAHGKSIVIAYDNSKVIAMESSKVVAYVKSVVWAYNNSEVVAEENNNIVATDDATVYVRGNSLVTADKNSSVEISGDCLIFRSVDSIKKSIITIEESSIEKNNISVVILKGNSTFKSLESSKHIVFPFENVEVQLSNTNGGMMCE